VKAQSSNENSPPIRQLHIQSIHPTPAVVPHLEPYLPHVSSRIYWVSRRWQRLKRAKQERWMTTQAHGAME
jgi:hypothetical protein